MKDPVVIEVVRKTVTVDCSVEEAFRVFTADATSWWPVESHSIHRTVSEIVFESRAGGEVYEVSATGEKGYWASVLEWEPPSRLVLAWNILHTENSATEVEVRFRVPLAVETTQWIIAIGSFGSALVALALALGLKDWFFRPRLRLVLRHAADPEESSDRIVTKRLETAETAAFVRLRLDNRGRSTARNVGVRVLDVHRWDGANSRWVRSRPELDGRLLQPSNQLASEPDLVDVFPYSDRIVDLASVDHDRAAEGESPIFVEISHPWPPNEANILEPATWQLELLVVGDNIRPERSFVTLSYDGLWPKLDDPTIWEHFVVDGPHPSATETSNRRVTRSVGTGRRRRRRHIALNPLLRPRAWAFRRDAAAGRDGAAPPATGLSPPPRSPRRAVRPLAGGRARDAEPAEEPDQRAIFASRYWSSSCAASSISLCRHSAAR
jgi:uncharacterized protein YndB with AHSA1/START domain